MKKSILTGIAFLSFAAASVAQNTARSVQIGTRQINQQTQNGSQLRSTVTQGNGTNVTANTYNQARTDQSGTQQTATVQQTTIANYNQALIRQIGDNQTSGNTAGIYQTGISTGNTARISQSGGASTATIRQEAVSTQNQATLTQIGDGNGAVIRQSTVSGGPGVGNVATLYQQGNNNTQTRIDQQNGSAGNRAYLNQYGSGNGETRISQSNGSGNNTARIDQGGDGPNGTYGAYGYAVNGGRAVIEQNNFSYNNTARIGQSGNGHDAQIYQNNNVSNSEAYIDQYPGGAGHNVGYIRQENQTGGSVRITQNAATYPGGGYGQNEARAFQGSLGYGLSSGNVLTIVQENAGNRSFAEQLGSNNLMEIKQYGNGNLVFGPGSDNRPAGLAHQEGMMNRASITQNSNGGVSNTAYLSQSGRGNTATIIQNGSSN